MFTPIHTALGSLLLYQGASGLLEHNGRVFGISSILSTCLGQPGLDNLPIILGLAFSVLPISLLAPSLLPSFPPAPSNWQTALATLGTGLLVGWGTKNGKGCTSGHMLCGVSRLSPRSLIATGIFFTVALITANTGVGMPFPTCAGSKPCYLPVYPTNTEVMFMSSAILVGRFINSVLVPRFLPGTKHAATIYSFIAGLEFGLGLLISGLANPAKVLGFFSWFNLETFDPSLAVVIAFALVPLLASYSEMKKEHGNEEGKKPPTLAEKFQLPTTTVADIDWRFVAGSAAFGVAWGLSGVCPGPGLLRTVLQPAWGACWMIGFGIGSLLGI